MDADKSAQISEKMNLHKSARKEKEDFTQMNADKSAQISEKINPRKSERNIRWFYADEFFL